MKFSKTLKDIRNFLEYSVIFIFYRTVRILPRSVIDFLANAAGWVMYTLPPFRKLVSANIRTALPELENSKVKRIARKSMANIARTVLEFFWFTNRPDRIDKYVTMTPDVRQLVDQCIANGERIIFVTPHLGNWEAAGLLIANVTELNFAVVVRPQRNPHLNRMIRSSRGSNGNDIIEAKGAGRQMLKAVKNGKSMATLIDQNTRVRDGGVFVNFFGLPVPASRAPAIFARYPKVKIFVGGGMRDENNQIYSFFEPLPKPESEYADETEMIQDLMTITEKYIRSNPEQYLWLYKRFQYIPKDADDELKSKFPYYSTVAPDKFYFKKRQSTAK